MSLLLAAHTQTFCAKDSFEIAQRGIKIIIHNKVIIFRVMAHFCNCLRHTLRDNFFAVLAATTQAAIQFIFRWR
ncbi:Uncharacterised protein [Enterobacter kobei]|nr:Uncharacterised protein [Enterobacter kobei]